MNEDKYLQLHIDNGAVPVFETKEKLNGGILNVPRNIFLNRVALTKIYDVNESSVDTYIDGKKTLSIELPDYALRCFVILDSFFEIQENGYNVLATQFKCHLSNNEENFFFAFLEVLPKPKKNLKLERKLTNYWLEIVAGEQSKVDDDILDGYTKVFDHFNRGILNNA